FFSSRRRHTISKRDWSSDVCSSDLNGIEIQGGGDHRDGGNRLLTTTLTGLPLSLPDDHPAVVLSPDSGRAHQHHIRPCAQSQQESGVSVIAQISRGAPS